MDFTIIYEVVSTGHRSCLSSITKHPGGYFTYKLTREDSLSKVNWYFEHELKFYKKIK